MRVAGFEMIGADLDGGDVIAEAVADAVPVIAEMWPLKPPRQGKVVVWTDWMEGYRVGLPWYQRLLLPVFSKRIRTYGERLWPLVGAITLRTAPPAVLIKPPGLLAESDTRLGKRLFAHLPDINERVRSLTCHELVHAFATGKGITPWLNEGIAMVTVDHFMGFDTVKPQTLELLGAVDRPVRSYLTLPKLTDSELVKLYARGYWITRYLLEVHPDVLRRLVRKRYSLSDRERAIAKAVGVPRHELWEHLEGIVFAHFHA